MQKIKKDLIRKAKLKKSYAKLKQRENLQRASAASGGGETPVPSLEVHPERRAMLDKPEAAEQTIDRSQLRRSPRPKPAPFRKEFLRARQRKEEQEQRRKTLEELKRQKQIRIEERERSRKQLEKARRPGRDGQRRLGRESKFLPDMVENLLKKLDEQNASRTNGDT